MKFTTGFILLCLLVSCNKSSESRALATEIMMSYVKQVCEERGPGFMRHSVGVSPDIKYFNMGCHAISLNCSQLEAGQLIIAVAEGFLKEINSNVKIRSSLYKFPITCETLLLDMTFKGEGLEWPSEQYVAYASVFNDKICFYNYNHNTKTLCKQGEELYEDVLELWKQNSYNNVAVGADL